MDPKAYKPIKLREQNVTTLHKNLKDLQKELSQLKVNKVASGVASKLAKIKVMYLFAQFFPQNHQTMNIDIY